VSQNALELIELEPADSQYLTGWVIVRNQGAPNLPEQVVVNGLANSLGTQTEAVGDFADFSDYLGFDAGFLRDLSHRSGLEVFTSFLVALGDDPVFATTAISMAN
jgi:hypothetical protein